MKGIIFFFIGKVLILKYLNYIYILFKGKNLVGSCFEKLISYNIIKLDFENSLKFKVYIVILDVFLNVYLIVS